MPSDAHRSMITPPTLKWDAEYFVVLKLYYQAAGITTRGMGYRCGQSDAALIVIFGLTHRALELLAPGPTW
jgi:hypothetical protein